MCDPIQVFGAMMSYGEKQQQADEQNRRATANYHQQVKQTQVGELQAHEAMSSQLFEDTLVARQNQAMIEAGAETYGGSIVRRLIDNQKATEARNKSNIQTNYEMDVQQRQYAMRGYNTQSHGRMVSNPSFIPTGLELYDLYNTDKLTKESVNTGIGIS